MCVGTKKGYYGMFIYLVFSLKNGEVGWLCVRGGLCVREDLVGRGLLIPLYS